MQKLGLDVERLTARLASLGTRQQRHVCHHVLCEAALLFNRNHDKHWRELTKAQEG